MKLINEYTIKIIICIICFIAALECAVTFFIYLKSISIFRKVDDETLQKTKKKTLELTSSIRTFASNWIVRTITDLKLISKYTLLYYGKKSSNDEHIINKNSKPILKNNKHIINADIRNLFIINDFYKIYKETGQLNEAGYPTESSVLDYKRYYLQIIGNETDNNIIINKLFKEHNELN